MIKANNYDLLLPGIRIIGECDFGGDSIQCSTGIVQGCRQYNSLPYWVHSFVPKLPWRSLEDSERAGLFGSADSAKHGRWIQVIKIPDRILRPFAAIKEISKQPTDQGLRAFIASIECQEAIENALVYARSLSSDDPDSVQGGSVFFKAPGLPTTTPRKYPELLGLHVDSWYKVPIEQRQYSPNRLSINLGLDDRFLLAVNVPVDEIEHRLARRCASSIETHKLDGQECEPPLHQLRTAFMSSFPGYPVIKVRIRPGEAYLAPTENMIHDGCTVGQSSFDVQFSVRGHFKPCSP